MAYTDYPRSGARSVGGADTDGAAPRPERGASTAGDAPATAIHLTRLTRAGASQSPARHVYLSRAGGCGSPSRDTPIPSRTHAVMPHTAATRDRPAIADVTARVLANTHLSDDYNVLALAAPEIAAGARPGQFVMLKPRPGHDPLLRRPFSIFEILRDAQGLPTGLTILNKRAGRTTGLLAGIAPGESVACLGPLGRPFEVVDPPTEAWMVAGGVGLAPFATLADALIACGTAVTLFYGARRDADLHCAGTFERRGVKIVFSTEDGSRGDRGLVTVPLARALERRGGIAVHLYACGPTPMMRAVAALAGRHGCRCDVSLEQVMGCGLGGCYSCVVRVRETPGGTPHFVRSCSDGPIFDAARIVWEEL